MPTRVFFPAKQPSPFRSKVFFSFGPNPQARRTVRVRLLRQTFVGQPVRRMGAFVRMRCNRSSPGTVELSCQAHRRPGAGLGPMPVVTAERKRRLNPVSDPLSFERGGGRMNRERVKSLILTYWRSHGCRNAGTRHSFFGADSSA